jgi:hypothetical protein
MNMDIYETDIKNCKFIDHILSLNIVKREPIENIFKVLDILIVKNNFYIDTLNSKNQTPLTKLVYDVFVTKSIHMNHKIYKLIEYLIKLGSNPFIGFVVYEQDLLNYIYKRINNPFIFTLFKIILGNSIHFNTVKHSFDIYCEFNIIENKYINWLNKYGNQWYLRYNNFDKRDWFWNINTNYRSIISRIYFKNNNTFNYNSLNKIFKFICRNEFFFHIIIKYFEIPKHSIHDIIFYCENLKYNF